MKKKVYFSVPVSQRTYSAIVVYRARAFRVGSGSSLDFEKLSGFNQVGRNS